MLLVIDTSHNEYLYCAVARRGVIVRHKKVAARFQQEEKLLKSIDGLLRSAQADTAALAGIVAVTGPGSFSSLRIGMTVANTLAWSLDIPVVGLKKGEYKGYEELVKKGTEKLKQTKGFCVALPAYGRKPHIT